MIEVLAQLVSVHGAPRHLRSACYQSVCQGSRHRWVVQSRDRYGHRLARAGPSCFIRTHTRGAEDTRRTTSIRSSRAGVGCGQSAEAKSEMSVRSDLINGPHLTPHCPCSSASQPDYTGVILPPVTRAGSANLRTQAQARNIVIIALATSCGCGPMESVEGPHAV